MHVIIEYHVTSSHVVCGTTTLLFPKGNTCYFDIFYWVTQRSGKPASCSPGANGNSFSDGICYQRKHTQLLLRESLTYIQSRNYCLGHKFNDQLLYINALVIEIYIVIKPRARMGRTHVSLQWQFNFNTNHFHFFLLEDLINHSRFYWKSQDL